MLTSATLKPVLSVAAALGLLSMGACETGKGLSLSAAGLTAANTANRGNLQDQSGGMAVDLDAPNPDAGQPSNSAANTATTSRKNTLTATAAAAKTTPTLAAAVDAVVANVDDSTGGQVGGILHVAGNAVLATGDDVNTVASATPLAPIGAVVVDAATSVGDGLTAIAANEQSSGMMSTVAPETDALSGTAQVVAAGQPVAGGTPAVPAPIGLAALSAAPAPGSVVSLGLANSGEPATVALVGASLVSTSIGNTANASDSSTSVVGVTAASATQTTGTLASVGLVSGGQLASVAVGGTQVAALPVATPAAFTGPMVAAPTYSAPPGAIPPSALSPQVIAGNSSGLLGSIVTSATGGTLVPAKYLTIKKSL